MDGTGKQMRLIQGLKWNDGYQGIGKNCEQLCSSERKSGIRDIDRDHNVPCLKGTPKVGSLDFI